MCESTAPGTCWISFSTLRARARLPFTFVPDELHVDRRGQAEIQDLAHDVGGLEEELDAREIAAAASARSCRDVIRRSAWCSGVQRDEDVRVGRADGAGVGVGRVDAAVGQADVVEDARRVRPSGISLRIDCLDLVGRAWPSPRCACRSARGCAAGTGPHRPWEEILPDSSEQQAVDARTEPKKTMTNVQPQPQAGSPAGRVSSRATARNRARSPCWNRPKKLVAGVRVVSWPCMRAGLRRKYITSVGTSVRERT